jgi:iron complex transport system permease protein
LHNTPGVRVWNVKRLVVLVAACAMAWAVVACAAMMVGSTSSLAWPGEGAMGFRLSRVMQASLVGAALAAAGVVFQSVLRNTLADPFLLGVASGAALGSYLWTLPAGSAMVAALGPVLGTLGQQGMAFSMGVGATLVVLLLAGVRGRLQPTKVILAGVIVSTIVGAILLLLQSIVLTKAGSGYFQSVLVGELIDVTRLQLWTAGAVIGVIVLELMRRAGRMNLTALSDDEAQSMGLAVARERWTLVALASLLTATAVAISGPIGFVGLICPHGARRIVGADHRKLLPVSMALGAIVLVLADALTRYLSATGRLNLTLPVGVVTALLGGPVFLVMLGRADRSRGNG